MVIHIFIVNMTHIYATRKKKPINSLLTFGIVVINENIKSDYAIIQ